MPLMGASALETLAFKPDSPDSVVEPVTESLETTGPFGLAALAGGT